MRGERIIRQKLIRQKLIRQKPIWGFVILTVILLGGLSGCPPGGTSNEQAFPQPAGSKSKTVKSCEFVEEFGEFKKTLESVTKYKYKYDAKGNMIEVAVFYNADGTLFKKVLCKYDEKGNMIEEASYKADGSLSWKWLYKYDEKGNKIEDAFYNADGSLSWERLYKYDAKGNEVERMEYRYELKFGKLMEIPEEKTTTEYEYY